MNPSSAVIRGTLDIVTTPINGKLESQRPKVKSCPVDALTYRQQEQLFHELAQFARSGVTLEHAFELLSRNPNRRIGACLNAVRAHLQASGNVGFAFRDAGFSESDAAIIQAGETSGRLDAVFLELGEFYRELAQARGTIIAKSIYPVLVLHAGAILLAIPPALLHGGWPTFFAQSLPILAVFYAVLILAAISWRIAQNLFARNVKLASALLRIPILGHLLRNWTAWKFASVLSLYVTAGGSLLRAFETAAESCGNALLNSATARALSLVQRGTSLADAFRNQPGVPEFLLRSIEIGEHAGRLDEESRRAAEFFKNKTLGTLDAFANWTPRILYLLVVLFTGWRIIAMASDVASSISSALGTET
jgi:type II secretory pathway component PulF